MNHHKIDKKKILGDYQFELIRLCSQASLAPDNKLLCQKVLHCQKGSYGPCFESLRRWEIKEIKN